MQKLKKIYDSKGLLLYTPDLSTKLNLPYIKDGINAGFPSPAEDFLELKIDLNKELIKNPSTTFFARVRGESLRDAGFENGDLLTIDRSLRPTDGKIAVCYIDGEFTIKRIKMDVDCIWLMPANDEYKPIKVTADNDFLVWGMVTFIIKAVF